jgi:transposase-like protein
LSPAERQWIAELLADPDRSFRSIAREVGVSDWTIRKIARELDGNPQPMKQRRAPEELPAAELSPLTAWLCFGAFAAIVAVLIWAGARWAPPPEF